MNSRNFSSPSRDEQSIKMRPFVILDFETVTPAGRPPEPLELAAMRLAPGLSIDQSFSVSWLIKPPIEAPLTAFDTRQTGIREQDIQHAPDALTVLREFDARLLPESPILVAHQAHYESSILRRFAACCPHAAALPCIDTVALAKHLFPHLPNYKLDTLAHHFSLPVPSQRHRALPDVRLTVQIFLRLLHVKLEQLPQATIGDLKRLACINQKEERQAVTQMTLFS
jgi:DNA polymerase III subunit epsilon